MQMQFPINDFKINLELPPIFAINERYRGNTIQQIILPKHTLSVSVQPYTMGRKRGYVFTPQNGNGQPILAITNSATPPNNVSYCIRMKDKITQDTVSLLLDDSRARWIKHPLLDKIPEMPVDFPSRLQDVRTSWDNTFHFKEEIPENGILGLRSPQIGSIHSVHAHWSVSSEIGTIVMPTGTGKTEVMLSVLVSKCCYRLLVIVPTDALRIQLAGKFSTLGILKDFGIVSDKAFYPIVGVLKHRPRNEADVDEFFEKCNVIVTTMNIAGLCDEEVQDRIAEQSQYLFIDEAHHVSAKTWNSFRLKFRNTLILQFTATPFREDGKSIGGKIIYNYPLRKAQQEGYFRPITFKSIVEYNPKNHDKAISEAAVNQLREDYDKGHILMARVGNIKRANEVFKLYSQYEEFNPVTIHTGLSQYERKTVRKKIINGEARIIVCVDMLGEGFDLPELKIAAFHDIRKSLAVTLQLAGRFTRARSDLGDPTFIANIADLNVKDEIRLLYTQDPDWNLLLPQASKAAIEEEANLWDFLEGFSKFPKDITLINFRPAMSIVIYKTSCDDWSPQNFHKGIQGFSSFENIYHDINHQNKTLIVVTNKKVPISWAQMEEIYTFDWELFIVIWNKDQDLLFIHGSSNSGYYNNLAKAIAGDDVNQIRGASVFRCFGGVNRLRLQNVGLLKTLGRLIRYEMRAGSDIEPGLTEAQKRNTIKSNLFGAGYEFGQKTTIGCSYKGRVWSRRTTNLHALSIWCSHIGKKLLDDNINPDEVLKGTLVPREIKDRPTVMPIGIEWPEIVYSESESSFSINVDGVIFPFHNTDINLVEPTENGDLKFEIKSMDTAVEFTLSIFDSGEYGDYAFHKNSNNDVLITYRTQDLLLTQFFQDNPPGIMFSDGSFLYGNSYIELKHEYPPFPIDRIESWDWTGTNIRKESQGIEKMEDSIQYKVIEILKQKNYEIIFDDDDSGEAADIVAIQLKDDEIVVEFYHCKYSGAEKPGKRIGDLYEVCGQAQKSNRWAEKPSELFSHLLRREPRRKDDCEYSRFEVGTIDSLIQILEMSRKIKVAFRILIVQPGMSKNNASDNQLELLSVTENYLMETYMIPFGVISSN